MVAAYIQKPLRIPADADHGLALQGTRMDHNRPTNVEEYRTLAKRSVPRKIFDYMDGGAEDELCLRRNREILDGLTLYPRVLRDVSSCRINTSLFGHPVEAPLVVGPTGLNGVIRRNGDLELARAAYRSGIPFVLSSAANSTIEDVAKVTNNLWFQLYIIREELTRQLLQRVSNAGIKVLVVTVDAPVGGKRERDLRSGFRLPITWSFRELSHLCRHPRWTFDYIRNPYVDLVNLRDQNTSDYDKRLLLDRRMDSSFSWERLRRLRDYWQDSLIVKGILHPEDSAHCAEIGIDGIVLSNHGGRQLDSSPSAFEVLPLLKTPHPGIVMADGGVRRGADVVKALGLGAHSVLLGRAPLYGLATHGEEGAYRIIEILKQEMKTTLMLIGCQSVDDVQPSHVAVTAAHRTR
jgi:(S)-mandelate dehydrogenase